MKKVLYISSESSLGGGANQSLYDMLVELKKYVNPIVIVPSLGDLESRLNDIDIKVYRVPLSRGYGKIGQHTLRDEERDFIINYRAAIEIKEIIEKESIELLHINSSICNAGAIAAILAGIPYVWHIREIPEEQFGCEFWDINFKKLLFKKTNKFITISICVQEAYLRKYAIESQMLYDGIDAKRFVQNIGSPKADNHAFLLAGRILEAKGQLDAIKAVKILKAKGIDNIQLYIVGDYSYRFEWCLKRYVNRYGLENNIYLIGFTKDLSSLRKMCTYAIVSSKFEALGRSTVEAMMAGNIVIGANTAGTLELIGSHKERGYIYIQGKPESLASAMLQAIYENKKMKIQEDAQNFALNTFNVEKYAIDIYNLYKNIWVENNAIDDEASCYLNKRYAQCLKSVFAAETKNFVKEELISEIDKKMTCGMKKIKLFLDSMNIKRVAIYGMGKLGCKLYDILEYLQVVVPYVIDRNSYFMSEIVKVFTPNNVVEEVDAVIITALDEDHKIREKCNKISGIKMSLHILEILEEL